MEVYYYITLILRYYVSTNNEIRRKPLTIMYRIITSYFQSVFTRSVSLRDEEALILLEEHARN